MNSDFLKVHPTQDFTLIANSDPEYLAAAAAERAARHRGDNLDEDDDYDTTPEYIAWSKAVERKREVWIEAYKRAEAAAK